MYAVPRVAPRDRDRVCANEFPLNKLDLFRFVLNSQKLRQTHSESVHLSSYSCRIVLQTQTSWKGTGKCGRVCTRVSFAADSFLIAFKTTLLSLHDYRESEFCTATMIRTGTGKLPEFLHEFQAFRICMSFCMPFMRAIQYKLNIQNPGSC